MLYSVALALILLLPRLAVAAVADAKLDGARKRASSSSTLRCSPKIQPN